MTTIHGCLLILLVVNDRGLESRTRKKEPSGLGTNFTNGLGSRSGAERAHTHLRWKTTYWTNTCGAPVILWACEPYVGGSENVELTKSTVYSCTHTQTHLDGVFLCSLELGNLSYLPLASHTGV